MSIKVRVRVDQVRQDVIAMHLMAKCPQITAALVPIAHGAAP
jgi:hypothetical protein